MSGIKKTVAGAKKTAREVLRHPEKGLDPEKMFNVGIDQATDLFTPDVPVPKEEPIIPIPDERSASLAAKKRRAKMMNSGRNSTILTEGLGG